MGSYQCRDFDGEAKLTTRQRHRGRGTGISINRGFLIKLKFAYFNSLNLGVSKKPINKAFSEPKREGPLKPKTLLFRPFLNILVQSFDYYRVLTLTGHQNGISGTIRCP